MTRAALLLTCEHGGARVPARYARSFTGARTTLATHRGLDLGALQLARELGRRLDVPLLSCTVTRLLVDANRSLHHRQLFSEFTRGLPEDERARIVERYWWPHRDAVDEALRAGLEASGTVAHVSVHSFTPRWNGVEREVDVGLLYDPSRASERALASRWIAALAALEPELRLRRNRPYRGTADGLTSALRKRHAATCYAGLELEVAQRFPLGDPDRWRRLRRSLAESLRDALVTR